MNVTLILLYGLLVFLATVLASIPFGFAEGFAKARGSPLSTQTIQSLKLPECFLEALAVTAVLASLEYMQPSESLLHAALAVLVGSVCTYFVEVRRMNMTIKEYKIRIIVGLLICAPLGVHIGAMMQSS